MEPIRPDFDGRAVTGIVPALVVGRDMPWMPEAVQGARSVVLLVLDGFGWNTLQSRRSALPAMGAMDGIPITTVAPSTTAAALTSIVTGLAPSQHGIVGYRMRVDGGIFNTLRWTYADGRRPPDPLDVQRHAAFAGREIPVLTKGEFRTTGFTDAHLRGGRFIGWSTPATLVQHCLQQVDQGEKFIYAYYPGIDAVAHEHGLNDRFFAAELDAVDALVGGLLDQLPESATLLITADHGQVHWGREGWVGLEGIDPLVDAYGGEGRFRSLFARRGGADQLLAAAQDQFGHLAWVFSRAQLFDEGWLGPPPTSASIPRRVGDVTLAARAPIAFIDPTAKGETKLLAGHGSLTPDEMLVPLLASRGRRH